ncbi:hypothetical protein [Bacillus sp. PK3_68]|uniref:hypothetical protein n=1 Tax=Bacillus sp. PK3_68 TaxID=2027408 RepID=UPI00115ED909|nr:hypothetical protein [Bacillus sp. PK3_68]
MNQWKKAVLSGTIAAGMMVMPLSVYNTPAAVEASTQAFDNKIIKKLMLKKFISMYQNYRSELVSVWQARKQRKEQLTILYPSIVPMD